MNPRLIIINGDMRGKVFPVAEGEISIGREPSNAVCVSDLAVSRRHCLIRGEGERFSLIDLGSFNGTTVNGVPVEEQPLEHRDQIAVGDTLFLFLLHEDGEGGVQTSLVRLEEEGPGLGSTIRLLREDAIYLDPERAREVSRQSERAGRDLSALLKISTTVNSVRELKPLQGILLQAILEMIPADRGVVLLTGAGPEEVISFAGLDRLTGSEEAIRVSMTVVKQVLRDGVSILSNDVGATSQLGAAESLIASQTRSLLCAPLVFFGSVIGAIYLSSGSAARFDEGHLQLLTGVAGIASVALENALHYEWVGRENLQLQTEVNLKHQMIGNSPQMRKVYHFIAQLAPADSTVLIRGESGTGKELAAHAIHLNSPRAGRAFVAINCAALPESLFESEFFGHEKGAFSGAGAQKKGLLEVAEGGTLFLDEVGELPTSGQPKLLRVLENNEFMRVGGTRPIKADVRIVAATNRNIADAIGQKHFREDLYHRLNVLSFEMPPLRERGEDILLLAHHFILQFNQKHGRRIISISPEARDHLRNYPWPGNVRELRNTIERAVVMEGADLLTVEFLPETNLEGVRGGEPFAANIHDSIKEAQKTAILKAFRQANGNYTQAAAILGIHPNHLHRLIRTLNLKPALIKELV